MSTLVLFLTLFMQAGESSPPPSGGPLSPAQSAYDTKHVKLVLEVFPAEKSIGGYADLELLFPDEAPQNLELDLVDTLKVTSITAGNTHLTYRQENHKIIAKLPPGIGKRATFRVHYHGQPWEAKRPPWDGGFNWSTTDSGKPWIGVSTQGYGGKLWYPSKAHPSDKIEGLTLDITVPAPLYCATNGEFKKMTLKSGKKRTFLWEYDEPISNYNVSLNIAEYRIDRDSYKSIDGRNIPLEFYFLKEYQKADQRNDDPRDYDGKIADLIKNTKAYLDFFERYYGPYPFKLFKVAHTHYLGMEHQTINSYGNHFIVDPKQGKDFLLFHEMAHEWWGNKVTVTDWDHFWIHEGIGTYATPVWIEDQQGIEAARAWFRDTAARAVSNQLPLILGKEVNGKENYGGDVYYKGALALHALRYLIGKDTLNDTLRTFATSPEYTYTNHAETKDFIALVEKKSGKELDWFFDVYFRQAAPPKLHVIHEKDLLRFRWEPEQFAMPLEVAVEKDGEKKLDIARFDKGRGEIELPEGATYTIDPNAWVYMDIEDPTKPKENQRP